MTDNRVSGASRDIEQMSASSNLVIEFPEHPPLKLHSTFPFNTKSFGFINQSYIGGQEFLMCPYPQRGFSVSRAMRRLRMPFEIIGPLTTGVLENLGYQTFRRPVASNFQLSETYASAAYDPADSQIYYL